VGASSANIGPQERVIGMASGKGEGLEEAIKNAIGQTSADTLVNVFIDSEWVCFFGCRPTGLVRVFGTLIEYQGSLKIPTAVPQKDTDRPTPGIM
jgi:hypothetical protein